MDLDLLYHFRSCRYRRRKRMACQSVFLYYMKGSRGQNLGPRSTCLHLVALCTPIEGAHKNFLCV